MKVICGIDPGVTGGLAFLYPDNTVAAYDIPAVDGEVDVDAVAALLRSFAPSMAVIERASAMPSIPGKDGVRRGMGAASTFKFAGAYYSLRTACTVLGVPYHIVTAGKWKGHFRLDKDKEKSRAMAIRLWPGCGLFGRKKDHGRAEAALIALYGEQVIESNRGAG